MRADFAHAANNRLHCLKTSDDIPEEFDCDMFLYCTQREVDYVAQLATITDAQIKDWRDQFMDCDDALKCVKPLLHVKFRFLKKETGYWRIFVHNERRLRSTTEKVIPNQCTGNFHRIEEAKELSYALLTRCWKSIKTSRGFIAELPPVFTYKMSLLLEPRSGWWVIAYTEYTARTAAYIMFDVYDSYLLWDLLPTMLGFLETINLLPALGSQANVD